MKNEFYEKYINQTDTRKNEKQYARSTAIGLQDVDELKTSDYLLNVAIKNIEGGISIEEAKTLVNKYYENKNLDNLDVDRVEEADKVKLAENKNEIYRNYLMCLNKNDVEDGVLYMLSSLKEKHIKIAIGSSSKNTKLILSKLNIINLFDAIIDGNDISKSKPDPKVFLKASSRLNLKTEECMIVENAISRI